MNPSNSRANSLPYRGQQHRSESRERADPCTCHFIYPLFDQEDEPHANSEQARIGQKPDGLAGLDKGRLFAELHQPVGIDQRRQQAGALAWKFYRL